MKYCRAGQVSGIQALQERVPAAPARRAELHRHSVQAGVPLRLHCRAPRRTQHHRPQVWPGRCTRVLAAPALRHLPGDGNRHQRLPGRPCARAVPGQPSLQRHDRRRANSDRGRPCRRDDHADRTPHPRVPRRISRTGRRRRDDGRRGAAGRAARRGRTPRNPQHPKFPTGTSARRTGLQHRRGCRAATPTPCPRRKFVGSIIGGMPELPRLQTRTAGRPGRRTRPPPRSAAAGRLRRHSLWPRKDQELNSRTLFHADRRSGNPRPAGRRSRQEPAARRGQPIR